MALTDENGGGGIPATMLVGPASVSGGAGMPYPVPMYGMGGGGGGNNGGFGDQGAWWVVLLIIVIAALGGNWGGNNNGGSSGGGYSAPIVISDGGNNGGAVQRGFDQAAVMSGVGAIQNGISGLATQMCNCCCDMQGTMNNGFANVQQSLCSGFAGVNSTVNGAQNAIAQQLYTNQIADLERSFAAQTASTQGMTALQAQLAQCCCDNRQATNDLRYTIATEECATRNNSTQNTRDIIENCNRNNQVILDKLFQLELNAKDTKIADLERQLTAANLSASQIAQTAQLERSNGDVIEGLYNRLVQCPIPSQPVYGSQAIFSCPGNNGCGGNNF